MERTILNIENVAVLFGANAALRGVTLKVAAGEFVGIVGPNGAGKTTLLTLINGFGKPSEGNVTVLGKNIQTSSGTSLRKRIGYVAQTLNIDPRMPLSVRETVMMGRYGVLGWLKRPGSQDRQMVDKIMELVGIIHLAERPIGHLSGGEQQRVAIARCLVQEPELFLLDEPTTSLDWKARTDILELVKLIHDTRNLTTLFVTHDLDALPLTCDRVILMKDGLIWKEGTPATLFSDENLGFLYDMLPAIVKKRREEGMFA